MRFRIAAVAAVVLAITGCAGLDGVVGDVAGRAVSSAVERRIEGMYAGFTDEMLFQLAYTQVFFLGGYGFGTDDFAEGEGATWRITSRDGSETSTATAERALLEWHANGDGWWYLLYTPEDGETLEYEVLVDREMQAREMYMRDPETGEIRHHEFAYDEGDPEAMSESEEALQEEGYRTETVQVRDWDDYRTERVTVRVGAGTFEADLLVHRITDEESGDTMEYRWWVTEDVPGDLVQYEFEDLKDGGVLHGEMVSIRRDYRFRLRQ
jgi:hypothetical protein